MDRPSIFDSRQRGHELMDDPSVSDERLARALRELALVNRWLGGHHATAMALRPMLRRARQPLNILDVGTGMGDHAVRIARLGRRLGKDVRVVGIDWNEQAVEVARANLASVDAETASRVTLMHADARHLPFEDDAFDVAHAALFLHHFEDDEAVGVLRELRRVSRCVVINDLHRHPIAYGFVRLLAASGAFGELFSHDGPTSVLRGFRRDELEMLFDRAGMATNIRWHPGFRWMATGR